MIREFEVKESIKETENNIKAVCEKIAPDLDNEMFNTLGIGEIGRHLRDISLTLAMICDKLDK